MSNPNSSSKRHEGVCECRTSFKPQTAPHARPLVLFIVSPTPTLALLSTPSFFFPPPLLLLLLPSLECSATARYFCLPPALVQIAEVGSFACLQSNRDDFGARQKAKVLWKSGKADSRHQAGEI